MKKERRKEGCKTVASERWMGSMGKKAKGASVMLSTIRIN